MALFFTYNINIDVDKWNLDVTLTIEEEAWINNQIMLADASLRSVSIGPELIQEFLMFSLGLNFTYILRAAFLYKKGFALLFPLTVYPHFTLAFFADILLPKNYEAKM